MEENIEKKLNELKEIEAKELAELKQRRILEVEAVKKENERKANEKLISTFKKERGVLLKNVEEIKKKNFALQMEYDSWACVKKKMSEDLKLAEKALNEKHEKIWKEREIFCDKTDEYLEEYGILSKWWNKRMIIINDPLEFDKYYCAMNLKKKHIDENQAVIGELDKEIRILKCKLKEEEDDKLKNDALLRELEMEKENLANEVKNPYYNSTLEKIEAVKKHCYDLTKLIAEKERGIKMLENPSPFKTKARENVFQFRDSDDCKIIEEKNRSDVEAATSDVTNNFSSEAKLLPDDFDEDMEFAPKPETKLPESFLFEMLDPKSIRAANAKAKKKSKS